MVFAHAGMSSHDFLVGLPAPVFAATQQGALGVDFFFVLSGFIIYWTNRGKAPDRAWALNFGESRLIRIFVPYLPVGLCMAALYTALSSISAGSRNWSWFASLTLVPSPSETALIVAWTLRHELVFYALFLLFYRLGRPFLGIGLWALACVAYRVVMGPPSAGLSYVLGVINIEFFAGMLAAWAVETDKRLPFGLIGLSLVAAFFVRGGIDGPHSPLLGCGLACWIVPLVRAEFNGMKVPGALVFLGAASYALYLVHDPAVSVAARVARYLGLKWWLGMVVFVLVGMAIGIAYHLIWERPVLAWIKHRRQRARLAREEVIGGAGPQIS